MTDDDDTRELYAPPDELAQADQVAARLFPGKPVGSSLFVPPGWMVVVDSDAVIADMTFDLVDLT